MPIIKKTRPEQRVRQALKDFDRCRTNAGVYRKLQAQKARGVAGDPWACPLADYLLQVASVEVLVYRDEVAGARRSGWRVPLTSAVSGFIKSFDRMPEVYPKVVLYDGND